VKTCIQWSKELREQHWEERRESRWQRADSLSLVPGANFTCNNCNRACWSVIGLYSHSRHCNLTTK